MIFSDKNENTFWDLPPFKDSDGATPLHRATDAGHDDTARMILDRGCSLDVADVDGDTALHVAVRRQNNEVLAVLLRKGANPDLKNSLEESPIHEAIRLGLVPTAQLLLRAGKVIIEKSGHGRFLWKISNALSFYMPQNVLCRSKFFEPAQKFDSFSASSKTFVWHKNQFYWMQINFCLAQNFCDWHYM